MQTIKLNAEILIPSENGLYLAVGQEAQDVPMYPVFPENSQDFYDRVVLEGFDLSGTPEGNTANWSIVQSWNSAKKLEFLSFVLINLQDSQIDEVYDRILFENKQV